jgi:hypothetical protein
MQIVPYVPIHPAQLFTNTTTTTTDDEEAAEKSSSSSVVSEEIAVLNDGQLFKIPPIPTAYTVEEPTEGAIKRGPAMKRYENSLSLSDRSLQLFISRIVQKLFSMQSIQYQYVGHRSEKRYQR